MDSLDLGSDFQIDETDLSLEWLEKYPVWAWGEASLYEPEDFISPVDLTASSIEEFSTLFVKASFKSSNNVVLGGYVMYSTTSHSVYCVNLFVEGCWFNFNHHLPDMVTPELSAMEPLLPGKTEDFFPITYECGIESASGEQINGIFDPPLNT
jgi:hypothetical protein